MEEALEVFRTTFESDPEDFMFARELVRGVMQYLVEMDQMLKDKSEHWRVSRMSRIDRNILRIGVFELAHCPDTPGPVIVDEAVELAKKFGEAKTPSFVNGILDRVFREVRNQV